jgi:hypothetical protein
MSLFLGIGDIDGVLAESFNVCLAVSVDELWFRSRLRVHEYKWQFSRNFTTESAEE